MTFFVTGAAGFIGLNTCEYLLAMGHEVIGVDNFCTSWKHVCDSQIKTLQTRYRKFSFLEFDLCKEDITHLYAIFIKYKPEYVIHLAAIPSVGRSIENPLRSIENNVLAATNVALACKEYNVKKLVYAGSSSYYGGEDYKKPNTVPNCKSPYAASKAAGELIVRSFQESFNLPVTVLRYFNVFGPLQNPMSTYSAVIPAFIFALLNKKNPIIFGDGTQSRDFTYITNVAQANYLACISEKAVGKILDVGCGKTTSLLQLLALTKKILGIDLPPVFLSREAGDVDFSRAKIKETLACLDACLDEYKPVQLKQGLIQTVNYYKGIKK